VVLLPVQQKQFQANDKKHYKAFTGKHADALQQHFFCPCCSRHGCSIREAMGGKGQIHRPDVRVGGCIPPVPAREKHASQQKHVNLRQSLTGTLVDLFDYCIK
jgi:hypothetical protein